MPTICRRVAPTARRMAICGRRSLTFMRNVLAIMMNARTTANTLAKDKPHSTSIMVPLASCEAEAGG